MNPSASVRSVRNITRELIGQDFSVRLWRGEALVTAWAQVEMEHENGEYSVVCHYTRPSAQGSTVQRSFNVTQAQMDALDAAAASKQTCILDEPRD